MACLPHLAETIFKWVFKHILDILSVIERSASLFLAWKEYIISYIGRSVSEVNL